MTHEVAIRWARVRGYLSVRDPWGEWHEILARQAPPSWRVVRRSW
jgi:hypothetical protein